MDDRGFWSKVRITEGCWEWMGARSHGVYGSVRIADRHWMAHRYTYTLLVGAIPEGLELDHLCRNVVCVRPNHLEAVTPRVNTLRGNTIPARNVAKTHCPQGHPYNKTRHDSRGRLRRICGPCEAASQRRYRQRKQLAA